MPDTANTPETTSTEQVTPAAAAPAPPSIRDLLTSVVQGQAQTQNMVQGLMQLNLATTRATFTAFNQDQRRAFCRSLRADGVSVDDQAELIGKSKPTVYRLLSDS